MAGPDSPGPVLSAQVLESCQARKAGRLGHWGSVCTGTRHRILRSECAQLFVKDFQTCLAYIPNDKIPARSRIDFTPQALASSGENLSNTIFPQGRGKV